MTFNIDVIEKERTKLQEMQQKWEKDRIEMGGDKNIIQFISGILFHGAGGVLTEDSVETTRNLFEAGYCYYFAKMLEEAFPNGEICLCYPYGHLVYVHEGFAYDINGVSDAEYEMYIPIKHIGEAILDFKHIPTMEYNISDEEIEEIGERCKKEKLYVNAISQYDDELVKVSRFIFEDVYSNNQTSILNITEHGTVNYYQKRTPYVLSKQRLENDLRKNYITQEQFDQYMTEYCDEIGVSYPYIKRLIREEELTKENKTYQIDGIDIDIEIE